MLVKHRTRSTGLCQEQVEVEMFASTRGRALECSFLKVGWGPGSTIACRQLLLKRNVLATEQGDWIDTDLQQISFPDSMPSNMHPKTLTERSQNAILRDDDADLGDFTMVHQHRCYKKSSTHLIDVLQHRPPLVVASSIHRAPFIQLSLAIGVHAGTVDVRRNL